MYKYEGVKMKVIENKPAAAIAEISDHGLTRHQNHRKRYTNPVPAPIIKRY